VTSNIGWVALVEPSCEAGLEGCCGKKNLSIRLFALPGGAS